MSTHSIKIINAQNVVIEYTKASLGNRIVARIIDLIVIYALFIVIIIIAAGSRSWVLASLLALPVMFYSFLVERISNGQSPGKKAMNLRVIAADGGQLTTYALLLRWVVLLADLWFTQGVAAIISIVVSEKGQRLGDLAADTVVISTQKKQENSSLYRLINNPNYEVTYTEAAYLSDQDIRTLRDVLNNRKMHRLHFIQLTARKVEEVLKIKAQDNDAKFLQKIVLDNAYLEKKSRETAAEEQ
jgi:uncharacterized RDD family membrane protein YckC